MIVLGTMAGGLLSSMIQKRQLTPTMVNTAIMSLVKGLAHLPFGRVIHRVLKPSNVLFASEGIAKIGDFGSPCATDAAEVHEDSPRDWESDVWALGLTLCEIVAQRAAFDPTLPLARVLRAIS
jgi:serine/threonine protein kinase